MIKVAFYLDNEGIKDIDCTSVEKFNPGIGGTPYLFFLLSFYLSKYYRERLSVTLLTKYKQKLNNNINNICVLNEYAAVDFCCENSIDIMVIRTPNNIKILRYIEEKKIKTITWSHNFITSYDVLKEISKNLYVIRNVFVSKEQYEYYIDDDIFRKSTYIYNLFDSDNYRKNIIDNKLKENIVTYIGSLIPQKGFHILAKSWKQIIEIVPSAQLYIVGGADLYNRNKNKNLNSENKYNKKIMKYLSDKNGNLLDGVKFLGILGEEKNKILEKSKVGIGNTGYKPETFGLTALEFEASGVPVIARKSCGYIDTINNGKTGFLFVRNYQLKKQIIKLLTDNELNSTLSKNAVKFSESKFDKKRICEEWVLLLTENYRYVDSKINNKFFRGKIIKQIIGRIRASNKIFKHIPSYTRIKLLIKKIIKRLLLKK